MSTDAGLITDLVLIAYLKRNDFTSIRSISHRVIRAKDGKKEVYLWVNFGGVPAVPTSLLVQAYRDRARVDLLDVTVEGDMVCIKHTMNAIAP